MERRADQDGGPKAAIHSGLESALGSHPCVALYSYQAFRLYGKCLCAVKKKPSILVKNSDKSQGVWGTASPIMTTTSSFWVCAETGLPAFGSRAPGAGAGDCRSGSSFPAPGTVRGRWRNRRDKSART